MSDNNGVQQNVKQVQEDIKDKAREAYNKADTARKDAVKQLFEVADNLRNQARDVTGEARDNMNVIARNLERTANDLNSRTLDKAEDVAKTAANNPIKSIMVIFFVGLLVGWWVSRK